MKAQQDCRYLDVCTAPLCPLFFELHSLIWFPDEGICRLNKFAHLSFIVNQKKIAKKSKDIETYYTYEMLNRPLVIREGIKGLDPDELPDKAKAWLKKHLGK